MHSQLEAGEIMTDEMGNDDKWIFTFDLSSFPIKRLWNI